MLPQGTVGPSVTGDGASPVFGLRQGKLGEQIVSNLHGKFYEQVVRGNVYIASNVGAQAVSVALATTYTGLCLSNPLASGKNLVLLGGQYALSVAPAAIASLHLLSGYSAAANVVHTTPLASPGIQNCLIGAGPAGVATVDSAATISTPRYLVGAGSGFTAAALYATTPSWINFDGLFVIPPGGFVAWGALTAVTGFGTLAWEEVPI